MSRIIIGFTGLAGSGKTTAAQHLATAFDYRRMRFAGPLKAMIAALGLNQEEIDGSLKETPCALLDGKTPRWAMQSLGTEWGRELISPNLWINAWKAAVEKLPPGVGVSVDDCRFQNEVDAIHSLGGIVCKIVRPGAGTGAAGHVSENDSLPYDFQIDNIFDRPRFLKTIEALHVDMNWAAAS